MITKFNTDWVWGEPARMTAREFVAKRMPTYMFPFGYVPAAMRERSRYGAGHGSEVSFVFNTLNTRWGAPAEATSEEKELARIITPIGQTLPKQVIRMARVFLAGPSMMFKKKRSLILTWTAKQQANPIHARQDSM